MLESVLLLVAKYRQEAQFMQTQVMVAAALAPAIQDGKAVDAALTGYRNTMFPYYEQEKATEEVQTKDVLKRWTSAGKFKVKPLWMAKDPKSLSSKLQRRTEKVLKEEQARRKAYKHKRL